MPNTPCSTIQPGGERKGDMEDDGRHHRDDGQPVAALAAVAFFEEIGERGHLRADVERHEEERQEDQREAGHPLEIAHQQPAVVAGLGQAHQVQAGDVGGEQSHADRRPAQRMGRQEIAIRLALLPPLQSGIAADGHDSQQVGGDDRQIEVFRSARTWVLRSKRKLALAARVFPQAQVSAILVQ